MPNTSRRMRRRRRPRRRRRWPNGPSTTPTRTLTRTFRYTKNFQLNNSTGSGLNQYAYTSRMCKFEPEEAFGFKDAQSTFELWRMVRGRAMVQPSYNNYNQSYNTINLDSAMAMQVWTAADWGLNETVSGVSIMSYQNARCHTLSLNSMKKVVDTSTRLNLTSTTPLAIMPSNAWLDTSTDQGSNRYNGFQLFARMPGVNANNYLPEIQVVFEVDVQFKQPAYQNRPNSFEADIVGSQLVTNPNSADPTDLRTYTCVKVELDASGYNYRFERVDGQSGSLTFDQTEMWEVYIFGNSGPYFGGRAATYTGPPPRKPLGYITTQDQLLELETQHNYIHSHNHTHITDGDED